MSLRSKTRRRLFMLSMIFLTVGVIAGSGAAIRLAYLRKAALRGRFEGLVAIDHGDYPAALKALGRYLGRYPTDADVLLAYAKARQNVQEPNGENLGQAISLYQRALELHPNWVTAQRPLLDLYIQVGFNTEAVNLADKMLAQGNGSGAQPEAVHAMTCKIVALMRMQRLDEAQREMQRLTMLDPVNLDVRILELQVMVKKQTPDRILAYASKLAADHPNDPRFQLLKSIAASVAGDNKTAADLVRPLVNQPRVDAAYTKYLIHQLDCVELFDESFSVILQAARDDSDPEMKRLLIRRLFETNQFAQLVQQTSGLDPASPSTDVESLAMRAMSLVRLKRDSQASGIIDGLEKRGQSETAAAKWAAVLHATAANTLTDPVKQIEILRDALTASPANSILEEALADAYNDAGLRDKSISIWRDVTRLAPEWSVPLVKISQSMIDAGRPADALPLANAALLRAPHDRDAQVTVLIAGAANLPPGPSPEADQLLAAIAQMRSQFPDDGDLLPLQVNILAQEKQHDLAIRTVRSALASKPLPPQRAILSLVQVSHSFALNLEEECFSASQSAYGLTIDFAFARALWLYSQHRSAEGLALLQQGMAAHPEDQLRWRIAWAQLLDITDDARAKTEWVALGDANPGSVKVQWGAVAARSVQSDHDFMGRTIDRLVGLLGDDSLSLHLLRARWYLHGNSNESDTTQAAILLGEVSRSAPDLLAPRLLLAACYMRLGNISGAIDQLTAASDAQPDAAALAIETARLLHIHGEYARSRRYIDRATQSKHLDSQVLHQAANLLAMQGDYTAALALLENDDSDHKEPPADLMLAALYRQLDQPDKAMAICKQLLMKPDASSVAFAADLYASQNQLDQARSALALLNGMNLPPGRKPTILANFAARYGSSDDALKYFKDAAHDAPQEPVVWQQLVSFCFASGNIDDAVSAADQAAHKLSKADGFDGIRQNALLLKQARNVAGTRTLLMTLGADSAINAPVLEAVRDLVNAVQSQQPLPQTAAALRQLADRNPRILALQTAALELYVDCGQVDEAVRLATRTVEAFPAAIEPARQETSLLGAAHRWDEELFAAKEWRRRDSNDAMDADLAIADAELQLGDVSAANQQIGPYLDRAPQDPDKFSGVLLLRARGLLASHQPEQVENLLRPLLDKSQRLRSLWITLAVRSVDDPDRAQAWLEQVSSLKSANADEKVMLANAWIAIAARWSNPSYRQTGLSMLKSIVEAPDAPIAGLLAWGSCCEESTDWTGAQTAYRRVIDRASHLGSADAVGRDSLAIACNNLASVLARAGGDLDEASRLIDKAIALEPQRPEFLDTRATVQAARKDYNGAVSSLREAQRVDPQSLEWRVNLLSLLADSGQLRAAKTEMQHIATDMPSFLNTSPQVEQRYQALCEKLK